MSCSDSDSPNTEKAVDGSDMGDVIGKEADEAETEDMSSKIPEIETNRQDADGASSNDDQGVATIENQLFNCNESDGEEVIAKEDEAPCSCDACKDRRVVAENTVEEMRRLQAHWMDLRQYIRMVYRMAMEVKSPTEGYQEFIKEHVHKLCTCDPHQLYQRLESQVQEFVIETKVRQLELLKREKDSPVLAYLFISGLLDSYKKLMAAANELAPLLEQLQTEHLSKFNLTWKVLNQHLYQSCVYTDPFVQNKVPECIAKLSNSCPDPGDANKKLVREFLSFDDEITLVGSMWREAEARIHQYNQEQATLKAKQRMMKEDWEFFKAQRKLIHQKIWNKSNTGQFDDVGEEAACHRSCPCDECAMNHLINCGALMTPPHSPALPPTSENGSRVEGEGREQTEPNTECECHVCTAPPVTSPVVDLEAAGGMNLYQHGGGFHLYPHIHGTGGVVGVDDNVANVYPHLYNIHSSLLANKHTEPLDHKQPLSVTETKAGSVLRPTTPPAPPLKRPDPPLPPAPPTTNKAKGHRHSTTQTPAPRLHQTLPDVVPPSCHNHDSSHNKRLPCPAGHGHDHDDETTPEDSCSDRSSSTQRGDSRHCDCCYCEVFGHGVPSVAPVSRNYTEMRERLRLLLTKKKAKCKSSTAAPPPASVPTNTPPVNNSTTANVPPAVNGILEQPKDPRDLEDLLDFIEGNPSQKCKDEKKAAKKARQKQKKQEEIERKKREEEEAERRRIEEEEAARALLKQQRKEAKKAKKKKKALEALAASGALKQEEQPQMVTIKRVMEPNSAEPTVTITLRGATPSEDKVLYTLLNGQVCQIPKDSNNPKNNQKGGKPTQQSNQQNGVKSKNVQNNSNISVNHNNCVQGQSGKSNGKAKKDTSSSNSQSSSNQKTAVTNNQSKKKEETVSKQKPKTAPAPPPPVAAPPPAPAPAPKLTSSTAIQINNAINCLSSRQPLPSFSLDSLKLPPGITITKVDPSQVTQQRKPPPQPSKPPTPPVMPNPPPQMPAASNVIVVDTGKLKDLNTVPNKDFSDDANGKKKKNKKKNGNGNQMNGDIPTMETLKSNGNNMVRLTMNGGPPKRVMPSPQPVNGKVMLPPQAAIIKVNGSMVTIRSPALQQALNASSADQAKKKKKKKKGTGQGQHEESWNDEESVFAPKDIDLESGEMDDAERELEAFKRFCLQSVPPKQKETPTHLNIKDIVLKKKSSAISCS
ncbi:protein FAM193A-like isoform X2 [Macrosteles quadrilineatus]|uniref:protein FAM193A-like isoform X2 n=1 Tax=Macrosteles quadrilineatus TaxID=74068 RepID=UPI0023E24A63|nr:protein FAM193A-like isoform X2 [Macrosteles quadrilineatus]